MKQVRDNEVIVACHTIRAEIEFFQDALGIERPIIWCESYLHNVPDKLREVLQEILDDISGVDRVLLGFGNCGNAIQGIKVGDYELVAPRIDDCISMLFGSRQARAQYSDTYRAFYQTQGWMDDGHNILAEYEAAREKYGAENAQGVFRMMYGHYETMAYLDTGLYSVDELIEETSGICEMLKLQQRVVPATLEYFEEFIKGPWPEERFVHVEPNKLIPAAAFLS